MAIIYEKTDEFPVYFNNAGIWYILLKGGKKPNMQHYTSSKTNTKTLLHHLKMKFNSETDILLGSWHGNRRTDLFVLEPKIIIKKFEEALNR